MASKGQKKASGVNRPMSMVPKDAAGTSFTGLDSRRLKFNIWPEWSDVDVNSEKWSHPKEDAPKKEDKKAAKSPVQQSHTFFDDPDGKLELPPSLKADSWKRPGEFIRERAPVVIDTDHFSNGFDLVTNNGHLHESEFLRHCISQIIALWEMSVVNVSSGSIQDIALISEERTYNWYPWEHIYSLCKVGKGPHLPLYNSHGKYIIRLYWMGCWRKITIDDTIPFDSQGNMLLPSTIHHHELWPMLLTKALIKVASLDYAGGNPNHEFGDMSVIQCLTGWIPEAIPLQQGYMNVVWELLKASLPEWKLPLQEWEKLSEDSALHKKDEADSNLLIEEKLTKDVREGKEKSKDKKDAKEKTASLEKGAKEDKKDKDKKDKGKEKSISDEFILPEKPEVVMFATYNSISKHPVKVSILGEMADASEKLRQNGLSHMYSHPVYIAQTRSCPLEPPPPPVIVPSWKLIRPRNKKVTPHDEPVFEVAEPKPIQCLEIKSPFINYKGSLVPIPTETHRPKSSLDRGGTRSRAEENTIEEGEENVPTPPPIVPESKITIHSAKDEESLRDDKHSAAKQKKSSKDMKNKPVAKQAETSAEKIIDTKIDKSKETTKSSDVPLFGESGGLAPPFSASNGNKEDNGTEEVVTAENSPPKTCTFQSTWMDYDVFMKCFRTLYVYHKSNTYLCNQRFSDLKSSSPSSNVSLTPKNERKQTHLTTVPIDSSAPFYLFVDNLAPSDIVVSFSVLARWFDPPSYSIDERKFFQHPRQSKEKDIDKEFTNLEDSEQKSPPSVTPGTLVAEPYSWKSLVTGQPILRLRTTGTKSAVLRLPPGRHVLRFLVNSPLGHHIHMCSTVNFLLGDEETVMPQLTSESFCFCEYAARMIASLGKCIMGFSDSEQFTKSYADFVQNHCPYLNNKQMSKTHHFQIFNEALYQMLRRSLKDIISPEVAFAWRAFTFDATTPNILGIPFGSRPATASHRSSGKINTKKLSQIEAGETERSEQSLASRQPNVDELVAAIKIQKLFRGYYVRTIEKARTPGTVENEKVSEILKRCWSIIEANAEENGLFLFREMFKKDPDIMSYYPFYKDEWSKISYTDYKGVFHDQRPMSWFVIFRDIFYVKEDILVVPSLVVPVNTCVLHVIDNDTGMEIPRVFQKVAPYVYKKNKKGFSFVAEARTLDHPLQSGLWRMRLIGSLSSLPTPRTNEVCCNFVTQEVKDYYVPNSKNIIFRQTVIAKEDLFVTIQMNTSSRNVYFKLAVLDNEEEVTSVVGKGHVVIPAITFLRNITQDDLDLKRSGSRTSNKNSPPAAITNKDKAKTKRNESFIGPDQNHLSRASMHSEPDLPDKLDDTRIHKYIIQATVLQNSWPLSENSWRFVQMLKEMEKNEIRLNNKEIPQSVQKVEKVQAVGSKAKLKTSKEKAVKEKVLESKGSRPSSQQFDITKPHWTLRVVTDAVAGEGIEVKKDVERAEEIRAMKKAWEDAEPGRAAKALQSRLKYLNSHTIKSSQSEDFTEPTKVENVTASISAAGTESDNTDHESISATQAASVAVFFNESETSLTLEPPPALRPKEIIESVDITPFIRKTLPEPLYMNEEIIQKMMEKRQQEIADFKIFREEVEKWREADKQNRNLAKMRQLEQYQALQTALDEARDRINISREAIRQRYLEAERLRLEELAKKEAEAAFLAEQELRASKGKSKSITAKKKK